MSLSPQDRSSKRRRSSSSEMSATASLDKLHSSVPRSQSTSDPKPESNATLRSKHRSQSGSASPGQQLPSPEESTALYHRSCELFPKPMTSRPNSPPQHSRRVECLGERSGTTRLRARPDRGRHDSAVGYFDVDPYRNSADEPRTAASPTSPTSVRRPPTDWNFARQQKYAADRMQTSDAVPGHMQPLLRFNSSSTPELSAQMLAQKQQTDLHQPPQTITYWSAPRHHTHADIESMQLWQTERHGLKKAFRLLNPAWLFRMRRRNSGAHGNELHYWDGEDDRCTVRRFKVR